MFDMNLLCGGDAGGGGGVPDTLNHELVYLERCRVEQLKISVLSGRGRVRGCGWVTLCGRGAASADMTAKWEKGEMMGKTKVGSVLRLAKGSRKHVVFI